MEERSTNKRKTNSVHTHYDVQKMFCFIYSEKWTQFQLAIFAELYVVFEFCKLHLIIRIWKFIDVQCAPFYNILFQIYFIEFKCNI
jgi:hypothetical protein